MLNQELNELDAHLKQLDHSLQEVYCIIDQILSDPAKDFSLTFKNYGFKIFNPIDLKEFGQVEKNKQKYLRLLLQHVMKKRINKLSFIHDEFDSSQYEMLYAFGQGEDPRDHQISKEGKEEALSKINKDDEKNGKKRPIDESSYQVKNDRVKGEDDV